MAFDTIRVSKVQSFIVYIVISVIQDKQVIMHINCSCQMCIDTLFLCFCEDCERNDGINRPYYMSRGLMVRKCIILHIYPSHNTGVGNQAVAAMNANYSKWSLNRGEMVAEDNNNPPVFSFHFLFVLKKKREKKVQNALQKEILLSSANNTHMTHSISSKFIQNLNKWQN